MMPWGWGMGDGWGFGIFGMLLGLVFWALLIAGIILGIKWLLEQTRAGASGRGESALEILKKRYARGEIDKEEFEDKKKDLQ